MLPDRRITTSDPTPFGQASLDLPSGTIQSGVPIYDAPTCTGGAECDIFAFDRNIKTPYMENYNLNIQQQITSKVSVQVGYVGSQGHRLFRFFDINQPSAQAVHDAQCPGALGTAPGTDCSSTPGATTVSLSVPRNFGNPSGAFYIFQENSTGKSNYNSLQASLRVNGWHGINSVVNYVWSRSLDNSSDGEDFVVNAAQPQDSNNPNAEYGRSNFDIPQRFTWVFGYEMPAMEGGMQKLKNGWGLDSTVYSSKRPAVHPELQFRRRLQRRRRRLRPAGRGRTHRLQLPRPGKFPAISAPLPCLARLPIPG